MSVKSEKEKRQGATLEAFYEAARILATDMDDLSTRVSLFTIDVFDPYLVDVAAMFNAVEVHMVRTLVRVALRLVCTGEGTRCTSCPLYTLARAFSLVAFTNVGTMP